MDILNTFGLDDTQAEEGKKTIIENLNLLLESFLNITDTPIDNIKNDLKIIDCYIKLRDIPYQDNSKKNDYMHLLKLPDKYREDIEQYRIFLELSSHI